MGLAERKHIIRNRLIQTGLFPQLRDVKRVRHTAHVEHQISLHRQAVFEAERGDGDAHTALFRSIAAEMPQQLTPELGCGKMGGVDDHIRTLAQRFHHLLLGPHRLFQRIRLLHQRMTAAGLLVALDDGLRLRLQKQQAACAAAVLQHVQHIEQLCGAVGGADIIHQRHLVIALAATGAELRKFQDHGRRHIIHNVKAHIL